MRTRRLKVHIGAPLSSADIRERFKIHSAEIGRFLLEDIRHVDEMANADNDSFRITEIVRGQKGSPPLLRYTYKWSAFYGCSDKDKYGEEDDYVGFFHRSGISYFSLDERPIRYPKEEF